MTSNDSATDPEIEAALQACAREPVHIPGAIQPHGALISCDAELARVRQVSANLEQMLGVTVDHALAGKPEDLFGRRWLTQVREVIDGVSRFRALIVSLRVDGKSRRFRLLPYRSGSRVVIELEPIEGEPERWLFSALAEWQSQLARFHKRETLLDAVTGLVRDLAGYDRVMIYRFDQDWNGSVVSESRAEGVGSYLGHHFPASDIPEQVRRLYSIKPVRDIPDATRDPVALVPEVDPADAAPLDLSRGILRAAAPIHRSYLANMNVVASMSIALYVDARLWGLLACHSERPNVLPPALRDALRGMVQSASFKLELIEAREHAEVLERANSSRDVLIDERGEFPRPDVLVERYGSEWLEVFRACGVALVVGESLASAGRVPQRGAIEKALNWLSEQPDADPLWSSHEIGHSPLADCFPGNFAGLLAVPLPIRESLPAWLLLFRQERIETRIWAGNPQKTLDRQGDKLSPRSSFEAWKEEVRGRSDQWTTVERRAAMDLATDLAALVAANEISRLNDQMTDLATHDHLTGLWNRYRMGEAIDHEIAMAHRYGRHCSLMMFDIDHFKHFNDSFGHEAGDEVLVRLARTVETVLREPDRVGRWGGEEFIVLAPDTDLDGGRCLAERLRRVIEDLDLGDYGNVTISIGLAMAGEGEVRRDLVARADRALYAAKNAGRNRVEVAGN